MLDDIGKMTDAERSAIGPEELLCLQQELDRRKAEYETHSLMLWKVFEARYADTCEGERDKDTGIVHIHDGDYRISQDVKKNVRWDQKKLKPIIDGIISCGDLVSDYLEATYKVPERKWTAWPQRIRNEFAPARVESPSRPSYSIGVSPR
ncbi:hypothetical protein AAJCM20276_27370 [Acetobacter aceti]|uniref:Uncharacterized protein n=2 Tax=Acetobacter aceti TaxID=435 RepID=A0A6S6PL94_ACEAC|nr:hypothetical protein AAJCM20276_27370 [Acetobacter aceti]